MASGKTSPRFYLHDDDEENSARENKILEISTNKDVVVFLIPETSEPIEKLTVGCRGVKRDGVVIFDREVSKNLEASQSSVLVFNFDREGCSRHHEPTNVEKPVPVKPRFHSNPPSRLSPLDFSDKAFQEVRRASKSSGRSPRPKKNSPKDTQEKQQKEIGAHPPNESGGQTPGKETPTTSVPIRETKYKTMTEADVSSSSQSRGLRIARKRCLSLDSHIGEEAILTHIETQKDLMLGPLIIDVPISFDTSDIQEYSMFCVTKEEKEMILRPVMDPSVTTYNLVTNSYIGTKSKKKFMTRSGSGVYNSFFIVYSKKYEQPHVTLGNLCPIYIKYISGRCTMREIEEKFAHIMRGITTAHTS